MKTIKDIKVDELVQLLPKRKKDAHKYSFGRLQLYAGSAKYPGAAVLCALGAFKAGCGYISLSSSAPREILIQVPELVLGHDLKATALVVGPGLMLEESEIWKNEKNFENLPKVIDATSLSKIRERDLREMKNCVLTPHEAEAAQILECDLKHLHEDRETLMYELAKTIHPSSVFILKGHHTLIAHNHIVERSTVGSVAQSSAGHGDVLSGILGALLAQGMGLVEAARLAVFSTGAAADFLSKNRYPSGVLAHEVANEIPNLWGRWISSLH